MNLELQRPPAVDPSCTLKLKAFRGQEAISRPFRFQLDFESDKLDLAADEMLGQKVTFSVELTPDSKRYFNGYVGRFCAGDIYTDPRTSQKWRAYRVEVVPWLWFLTRTSDCRIFQDMTVTEIIEEVFKKPVYEKRRDYQVSLGSDYPFPKREYCVQYRETDFAFVSRLMEEEGIFYFFEHQDGKHTLHLANHHTSYLNCRGEDVSYDPVHDRWQANQVTAWQHHYEFRTGKWTLGDYNRGDPANPWQVESKCGKPVPGSLRREFAKYEFHDYPGEPGNYEYPGDAEPYGTTESDIRQHHADVRMGEEEAAYEGADGTSTCPALQPGWKFEIRGTPSPSSDFVITSVRHRADGQNAEKPYENTFACLPDSVTCRPERVTPGPFVRGAQTAVVTGPENEKTWPDEYGRVKVRFHWDRHGTADENSSCWVRVSQGWAGDRWGAMHLPHVGQEVIVDFLEGDPDRPIITGRVYNPKKMPPLMLQSANGRKRPPFTGSILRDEYGNQVLLDDRSFKCTQSDPQDDYAWTRCDAESTSPNRVLTIESGNPASKEGDAEPPKPVDTPGSVKSVAGENKLQTVPPGVPGTVAKRLGDGTWGTTPSDYQREKYKYKSEVVRRELAHGSYEEHVEGDMYTTIEGTWFSKIKGHLWGTYYAGVHEDFQKEFSEVFYDKKTEIQLAPIVEINDSTSEEYYYGNAINQWGTEAKPIDITDTYWVKQHRETVHGDKNESHHGDKFETVYGTELQTNHGSLTNLCLGNQNDINVLNKNEVMLALAVSIAVAAKFEFSIGGGYRFEEPFFFDYGLTKICKRQTEINKSLFKYTCSKVEVDEADLELHP